MNKNLQTSFRNIKLTKVSQNKILYYKVNNFTQFVVIFVIKSKLKLMSIKEIREKQKTKKNGVAHVGGKK